MIPQIYPNLRIQNNTDNLSKTAYYNDKKSKTEINGADIISAPFISNSIVNFLNCKILNEQCTHINCQRLFVRLLLIYVSYGNRSLAFN